MILGMPASTYTLIHGLLGLVGIGSGFVVLFGMLARKRLDGWTAVFLITTVLTSVTGFGFPFDHLLPSHIVGIISLAVLALAIVARYPQKMAGGWRRVYVISSTLGQYFNVFVLVVQGFLKVPALHELAPTQGEPPFSIAQGLLLVGFVVLGTLAAKKFEA